MGACTAKHCPLYLRDSPAALHAKNPDSAPSWALVRLSACRARELENLSAALAHSGDTLALAASATLVPAQRIPHADLAPKLATQLPLAKLTAFGEGARTPLAVLARKITNFLKPARAVH